MKAFLAHLGLAWRLHLRNRMALIYGYVFPLVFLAVFWVLYRHEPVPLLRHFGALLAVTALGGACFGLPTTLVGERERGVWRRYRLTPVPPWTLLASTAVARYFILLSAGLLQLAVALAVGMTLPENPSLLVVAYTATALAFIGLGLVLATLADNVPAVQALGQCVFLPMLVIGGVAVPLTSLPTWAQTIAGFFPGRYAVESMQSAVDGRNPDAVPFALLALGVTGLAGLLAATRLFRWESHERFANRPGKAWLLVIIAAWSAVGLVASAQDRARAAQQARDDATISTPAPESGDSTWQHITARDVAGLDFQLPPDHGVVAPFAAADERIEDYLIDDVNAVATALATWPPGLHDDPVQRMRFLLCLVAVPDVAQDPRERHLPVVVLAHLQGTSPKADLIRVLAWIALHPNDGAVVTAVELPGLSCSVRDPQAVRERVRFYALKCLARLTGRPTP